MKYVILFSLFWTFNLFSQYEIGNVICGDVIMENETDFIWNKNDYKVLETAKNRCFVVYGPQDAPCVYRFIKRGERDFRVNCGAEIVKK